MKPNKPSKCDVCATPYFERNNYFYGKQFTVRDLVQEQSYINEKRHLINRMVLGWGVVCGLDVKWDHRTRKFNVETGMALDCCGREIIVCEPKSIPFEDYDNQCRAAHGKYDYECKFVLCLEYDDCYTEPVNLPAVGCDVQERNEFNRVRDGFKLTIKRWEDACPKQPYNQTPCLDRFKSDYPSAPRNCETETIHQHLCQKLKECSHECDVCDCVVLATITVKASSSGRGQYGQPQGYQQAPPKGYSDQKGYDQYGGESPVDVYVDTCTDRRFVYNNSLLYDLIYCHHGDLPHIVDFSWREFASAEREIEFDTFVDMVKKGLTVYFDQEMAPASLNSNTFIVSYIYRETGTGTYIEKRIPAKQVSSGRDGNCYTATFEAQEVWITGELDRPDSELRADPRYEPGVNVEILLRGSRIWSSDGKGLDGDYLADKLPTGNGTQGGDFVDWFRVIPSRSKKPTEKYEDF